MGFKKRKIVDEKRGFNETWTNLYFFIEIKEKPLYLICQKSISVVKEYNLKRHYDIEYKTKFGYFEDETRKNKIISLKSSFKNRLSIFKVLTDKSESAVRASYKVAEIIAKHGCSFNESELVKGYVLEIANDICSEQKDIVEIISLSDKTCVRRTEYIRANLFEKLKDLKYKIYFYILPSYDRRKYGCVESSLILVICTKICRKF